MGKRETIKTTRSGVFLYWKDKAIMPDGSVVPVKGMPDGAVPVVEDWGEPCCWGCGRGFHEVYGMRKYDRLVGSDDIDDIAAIWDLTPVELERCHVLADAAGGEDKPENLFLLCHRCHAESPDTTEPPYFFRWVHRQRRRGPTSTSSCAGMAGWGAPDRDRHRGYAPGHVSSSRRDHHGYKRKRDDKNPQEVL